MPNQPYNEDQNRANRPAGDSQPYSANRNGEYNGSYGNYSSGHPYQSWRNSSARSDLAGMFGGQNGAPFQFPWWAIVIGFAVWWPLGFIFWGLNGFLRQNGNAASGEPQPGTEEFARKMEEKARRAADKASRAVDRAAEKAARAVDARRTSGGNTNTAAGQNQPPIYQQPPAAEQAAAGRPKKESGPDVGMILTIVGMVLAFTGGIVAVDALGSALAAGSFLPYLEDLFTGGMFVAGSIGMWIGAGKLRAGRRLRRKIASIVGSASTAYIEDIAAAIPCSYEKCCKYLEDCIEKGVFEENSYLDMRTRSLVVRGKPPVTAAPAPAAKAADTADTDSQYRQILRELQQVNDAIPDAVMSDKISRLQQVAQKIFEQAEQNPDKLPQMRRFMDYYLPTALKLLKTYAELDAQGIEGDNIRESKRRIEQVMDTMVTAFENQLDQLFRNDALDVSSDIDVMENMLKADGLAAGSADPFDLYHGGIPQAPEPPKAP